MKLALYRSIILSLSTGVCGLPGWPVGGTIVAGNAVQFDRDSWEANLARPNATGDNSITGFDISRRWPGSQIDGWHLSINVTSDIPDSQTMSPSNATGNTFTGTSIFLAAPDAVRAAFASDGAVDESTWKICVIVIPDVPQGNITVAGNDGNNGDGTCSVVSSRCVDDLERAYAAKFARNQDCYGTPPPTPPSCGGAVNTGGFNVQQLPLGSISGREVFVTASEPHDPDDGNAWGEAARKTWPVLVIWGWNARADAPDDASPTVQLSCISARDVVPGSKLPSSAGVRDREPAAVALIIAGLAAYALF